MYRWIEKSVIKEAQQILPEIEKIDGVKKATFSSKENELDKLIEMQDKDGKNCLKVIVKTIL